MKVRYVFIGMCLALKELSPEGSDDAPRFEFGDKILWLDCS